MQIHKTWERSAGESSHFWKVHSPSVQEAKGLQAPVPSGTPFRSKSQSRCSSSEYQASF